MLTLRPLRSTIIGLGLFAAASSAQAQLLITFLEDTEKGHLSVIFSGQDAAPFRVASTPNGWGVSRERDFAFVVNHSPTAGYISAYERWESNPWGINLLSLGLISNAGTGGFLSTGVRFGLVSTTSAEAGQQMSWEGILIYTGNLAAIGLEEGDSGTLVFTENGTGQTFEINWETAVVVPEPATYALALGLGVAGVALLRRRSRR